MTKCLICGYYGQGNAGDEALLISLLEMLPNQVEPIVLSGNPEETRRLYHVESYSRLAGISLLSQLGVDDCFIWGGGSLMQDATSIRSPLYYSLLMAYAQLRGLTTIAYGQGIGPLEKKFTRWLAKQVLSKCTAISVRDQNSAQLLSDWHLNYIVAPDPVWTLSSQPCDALTQLKSPTVAINLRSHCTLTSSRIASLTQALILFQEATQASIVFIPFQAAKDLAIATEIGSQLAVENKIINLTNPREIKGLFAQVEMVIGMRLHSLIMGAAAGCSCFALSYDPKVDALISELNISGYKLGELPTNPHIIKDAWLKNYHNQQKLSGMMINSLKEEALLHKQLLEKYIKLT